MATTKEGSNSPAMTLIREFVDVVQNAPHDVEAMDRFFSPEFVNHDILPSLPKDLEGSKELHRILIKAFPDMKTVIQDQSCGEEKGTDGNGTSRSKVWTMKSSTGTHLGPWFGMPPTETECQWRVIDIMTVEDGQITEHWVVSDFPALMKELRAKHHCSLL